MVTTPDDKVKWVLVETKEQAIAMYPDYVSCDETDLSPNILWPEGV